MVDPQWDIWYWGSKWNLHTVCWSGVGCEWGTTSVYFGITYVCFVSSRLPVFAVEPQYLLQDFLFLSKVSFEGHVQNLHKISCWFKIWMRFVGPILIKLWTSCIWGFPYWPALRAGLLCCNFFGQPGSVSKFPPLLWVKLWVGWVGRGYTEISRYFPASWINCVTLVTKIKLLYSLRF